VHIGNGGAHTPVALVFHQKQGAGLGDGEIDPGKAHLGAGKALAHHHPGNVGQLFHVFGIGGVRYLVVKNGGHFILVLVNRGHNDVRRCFVVELNDELAQIGLHGFDAVLFEKVVQVHLFGDHRLALDNGGCIVATHDLQHDLVGLVRIFSPVHLNPIARTIGLQLLQQPG
jgi:hypothetical protein